MTEESKALDVLADAGLTSAEQATELEWAEIDRIFTGRPAPVAFKEHGDSVLGRVVRGYTRQKTKFGTNEPEWWDDGSPKLEPVIEILTAQGLRSLYVSSWRMQNAIGTAFAEAGVRGPRRDGMLLVKYVSDEPTGAGGNPAKVYEAGYDPPGKAAERLTAPRPKLDEIMPAPTLAGVPAGQDTEPPF
jgi:hypothetical protein